MRRAFFITLVFLLYLGSGLVADLDAQSLTAGAARVLINPPLNLPMAGYGARQGVSQGVLDDLQAKVLVLGGKENSVAFVTMDLIGVFPDSQQEQLRSRVRDSVGIQDIIFSCSHTHSGPSLKGENPDTWQKDLVERIGTAIEDAWKSRQSAKIGSGAGQAFIGHNRLYYKRLGGGKMLWRNETKIRTSPVDPTVMVVRLDRQDGSPLALIVNYACHPVVLGPENLHYSADYPGEMMRMVESSLDRSICFFVQGAAGDINPYYDKTPPSQGGVELMRETGRELGKEVLRVARSIITKAMAEPKIKSWREPLQLRGRWNEEEVLARLRAMNASDANLSRVGKRFRQTYSAPLTLALIGNEVGFVGTPAEIFVDYQIEIRERWRDFPLVFAGYTNGSVGYVPTIQGAVDGGYGASELGAFVEVGAGDMMIDRAVIQLARWTGKLKDKPPGR